MDIPEHLQADYDALTENQKRFVALWSGQGKATAEAAGYSPGIAAKKAACRNMRNPIIKQLIALKRAEAVKDGIMTRTERQELWSRLALDPTVPLKHRLKATELLGKSQGDFIDRFQDESGPKVVKVSYVDDRE
jgi:phage terminase small subunit